jgi:DNA-directed RNA polymerase III subunit RPC1
VWLRSRAQASFLLTQRDTFLTRDEFCALCVYMCDGGENVTLPEPAILRPVLLWTGSLDQMG